MTKDVRFALRLLGKSPLITIVAVGSLALGIGSTTAVFSLVDALLLRPLPALHDPESLVAVVGIQAKDPEKFRQVAWADYLDYAAQKDAVANLAAMADCDLSLTHHGPAERVSGLAVSSNYFTALGLKPTLGRLLSAADEKALVTVLGYDLWQRRFGGDFGVIGSVIQLNGKSLTVVGIAPKSFAGTSLSARREIWLPLGIYSKVAAGVLVSFTGELDRKQEWLNVLGRLPAGMSREHAQAALNVVAKRLAASYPDAGGRSVRVLPLTELALGPGKRDLLKGFSARLMAITALVLAVAVINVAGLLLTRALARQREVAIRLSLGASRGRLIRQFLVEGFSLALLGLAGGILLATAALPLLERLDLPVNLAVRDYTLSYRTLGFALLVSLASCLVIALAPALQAMRTSFAAMWRGEKPRGRRAGLAMRELLAGTQVALTLLVLIAAGLMLRTLANLGSIDPGFDPARVLAVSVDLYPAGYEGTRVAEFYRDLLERLKRLPGVEEASMASALPVMGGDFMVDLSVTPDDAQPATSGAKPSSQLSVRHVLVGSRFFETTKMRLVRGRSFGAGDDPSGAAVVIVNETAARLLWGGRDALGRRLRLVETETPFEVIGIVADASYGGLKDEAVPVLYLAHAQYEKSFLGSLLAPQMTVFVRTSGEPRQMLNAVRETVRAMDERLPVFKVSTLEELLVSTVGVERQAAALYTGLALVATALAMFGLWGVLTQTVIERTREIGIRMACGASPGEVRTLILQRSLVIAFFGVAAGLAIAVPARRIVASQLYGVGPADPVTWLGTTLILIGLALFVSTIPAYRAARVDPVVALRYE
jgi:predicted permease